MLEGAKAQGSRSVRAPRGLAVLVLLCGGAPPLAARGPQVEPAAAAGGQEPAGPEAGRPGPLAPRYHGPEEARERLTAWRASGLAEPLELGRTTGGRELLGVQFGGLGSTPLAERTSVLLLGGLDGISLAGTEAVLAIVDRLLAAPQDLPADVTFVALPWANPDGLARWLASGCGQGRNDRPTDDDDDGRIDEDGPDDLDGDGVVVELLVEDPAGPWARVEESRLLRPANPGDGRRYVRVREGKDDDGDGRYNEDGPGGVVLDRSFPLGWSGPWNGAHGGPWPLSEPEAEALARLALGRRTALVLLFQGNHGRLAVPGGLPPEELGLALPFPADEQALAWITQAFARHTGRPQEAPLRLEAARGAPVAGAALDWFYAAVGALACEVAVWGPEVQRAPGETVDARYPREGAFQDVDSSADVEEEERVERAWGRWLDDLRGGIGFVDWQPVDLGGGREGWVGGWEPATRSNPPPEVLPEALEGLSGFVLELAQALPRPQIEVRATSRRGHVAALRVRVVNPGLLPTGVGPGTRARGPALRLRLPEGVSLIAGEEALVLDALPARGVSAETEWLVVAPEETPLRIELELPWAPVLVREVRL